MRNTSLTLLFTLWLTLTFSTVSHAATFKPDPMYGPRPDAGVNAYAYSSGYLGYGIYDYTTTSHCIYVPDSVTVGDVDVSVNLTHTFDGDLDIYLYGPTGTYVDLSYHNGGGGDNFTGTTFDDEASTYIYSGTPPFSGSFKPQNANLSAYDGQISAGNWCLYVADTAGGDSGVLSDWSVSISPGCSGYDNYSHYVCSATPYSFDSFAGTTVVLSDDQLSGAIPIGFNFYFYALPYTNAYISSNGFLAFNGSTYNGCCSGGVIPSNDTVNGIIAGWWEDLHPGLGGTIQYATLGSAPNRRLVVEFNNIQHYGGGNPVSLQFKLYESSNIIEVHYTAAPSDGGTHAAGIEDISGVYGKQYWYSSVGVTGNLNNLVAIRYTPPSPVPVTLGAFESQAQGEGKTAFSWQTATETANVGFNLYAADDQGLVRLNERMLVSQVINSAHPHDYVYVAQSSSKTFYLEEVDIHGKTRMHGPFALGQAFGARGSAEPIDWSTIRATQNAFRADEKADALPAMREHFDGRNPTAAPTANGQINLLVNQTGLQRVTYQDFVDFGVDPASFNPRRLALLRQGQPEPVTVYTSGRFFGPGSYIEFYGEALDTLYTRTNVYTLTSDPNLALRIPVSTSPVPRTTPPTSYQETVTVKNENGYSFITPNGDPWYDTLMMAYGAPFSQDFTLVADDFVADAPDAAQLSLSVWGLTEWDANPDHRLQVSLNGVLLADEFFDGFIDHPFTVTLPPGSLQAGSNTLTLTVPVQPGVDWDMIYLNSYSLTYPRAFVAQDNALSFTAKGEVFEVSGFSGTPGAVYRLTDTGPTLLRRVRVTDTGGGTYRVAFRGLPNDEATYLAATAEAMHKPILAAAQPYTDITSGSADYLILSHPSFIAGLDPFVQFHQARGLNVKVVNVNDVYAQFSYGVFDPAAIHAYLTHALEKMGVQYILLVGGDTYDYLDNLELGSISFIPSLYADIGPYASLTPVDPLFTDVNGDNLPDGAIGRWPVRDSAELALMIDKTIAYAAKDYTQTALMAADAADGVSFTTASENFIAQLGAEWSASRAYVDALGVSAARDLLLNTLNGGVALTSFFGHSGPSSWTFAGLFQSADAVALTNHGRPTVVTQWGCWNTYYVDPAYNTLAHTFLLSGDQGAAAVLGATAITQSSSDEALGLRVLPRAVQPGMALGTAVQDAKTDLALTLPGLSDVILGWTLLGDPAMVVEP